MLFRFVLNNKQISQKVIIQSIQLNIMSSRRYWGTIHLC